MLLFTLSVSLFFTVCYVTMQCCLALTHTHTHAQRKTHSPYSILLVSTTRKLSLKRIFSQNITSCSVQLRAVIITFRDVVELSASTVWIFWSTTSHPSKLHFLHPAKDIQMHFRHRSLTLRWGCCGGVNFLVCFSGRAHYTPFGDWLDPSCLSVLWCMNFFTIGGPR